MAPGREARSRRGPVPIAERGPGWTYRPDMGQPSLTGRRQPGIVTPQLDHLRLVAYDLSDDAALESLLRAWTGEAQARMVDAAGSLTVTVGLGAGVFDGALRGARPLALRELPPFPGDALEPGWCGGDVCLQVCAASPELAQGAVDALARAGAGAVTARWDQRGFLRRDGDRGTPRDVLGFRDGSMNLRRPRDMDKHVWAGPRERTWMTGGTYLVVRRIRADLGAWRALPEAEQEQVIGRRRRSGAPLGGRGREFDPVPLDGPHTPPDAHARLAQPRMNDGAVMLRRGYAYDDGPADSGLVFLAFARDPHRQIVPVQRRLAEHDALGRFTTHVGSALFAIPPGTGGGPRLADGLFART